MLSTDFAYSYPIFNDKIKFTLKLSDVFNTRGFGIDTRGEMFDQKFDYKRQSRYVIISFNYNFGDQNNSRQDRRGSYGGSDRGDMDGGFF